MLKGFREFIIRGNVIDLAVGVVIGGAFGTVISAFVRDLLTPLIAAFGGEPDFSALYFTLNQSRIMYGDFLNAVLSFLIIGSVIYFLVVLPVNQLTARTSPHPLPSTRKCPECLSEIALQARKCAFCTSTVTPVGSLRTGSGS